MSTHPSVAPDLEESLSDALERHLFRPDGSTPRHLAESIRYSLLAPGKRIRPRLTLACARMIGLSPAAALPAALAIEMVHCFTLIHDDLPCMDDDDFRRGRPSNHKQFGEATALLAGDGLLAVAVDTLLDSAPHVESGRLVTALRRLSWAMGPRGVIGGQAAESLLTPESAIEDLNAMFAGKTGALFSASLLIPKDLAGIAGDTARSRSIDAFAAELGFAFQVVDDLEDAADPVKAEGGKPTNILFFLSERDARESTAARLNRAIRDLMAAWETRAEPLITIAEEVAHRLVVPKDTGGAGRRNR